MYDLFTRMEVTDGVTVISVNGTLSVEGLLEITDSGFYGLTRQAIWDHRDASLKDLNRDKYVQLSRESTATQYRRRTQSVAIVLNNETDLRHFRFYTLVSARESGHRTRQFLTCSIQDAWAWLKSVEHIENWETVDHDVPMRVV